MNDLDQQSKKKKSNKNNCGKHTDLHLQPFDLHPQMKPSKSLIFLLFQWWMPRLCCAAKDWMSRRRYSCSLSKLRLQWVCVVWATPAALALQCELQFEDWAPLANPFAVQPIRRLKCGCFRPAGRCSIKSLHRLGQARWGWPKLNALIPSFR